jgi:hypothetical protein
MAEKPLPELSPAVRFQLQTILHNSGVSDTGAMQFANDEVVHDPKDRATVAALMTSLMRTVRGGPEPVALDCRVKIELVPPCPG